MWASEVLAPNLQAAVHTTGTEEELPLTHPFQRKCPLKRLVNP